MLFDFSTIIENKDLLLWYKWANMITFDNKYINSDAKA